MNLIIDGHAFLNVAINVTKAVTEKYASVGQKYWVHNLFGNRDYLKEEVRINFRNFIITYLNSLISPIGSTLEGVYFVLDSKSWRKEYIDSFFKNSEFKTESAPSSFKYKGNRKYDDHQYLFFEYFENTILPYLCEKCGLNAYRSAGLEGDDWIAYLCEVLTGDIVIYSVDQDIKQTLYSSNKNICLITPKQVGKSKRIYVSQNQIISSGVAEEENDSFFSLNEKHMFPSFFTIVSNYAEKGFEKFEIDPIDELLSKIFLGDKSDNIPRLLKMTQSKLDKIFPNIREKYSDSEIMENIDSLNEDFIFTIIEELSSLFKLKNQNDLEDLREHIIFNIRIIRLATSVFPEEALITLDTVFSEYSPIRFKTKEFNYLKNNSHIL